MWGRRALSLTLLPLPGHTGEHCQIDPGHNTVQGRDLLCWGCKSSKIVVFGSHEQVKHVVMLDSLLHSLYSDKMNA